MAHAVREIEERIDRSRAQLASHLEELGQKVENLTSWREHVRARPYWMLGLAMAGGAFLGAVVSPGRPAALSAADGRGRTQASELIGHLRDALLGVAAVRLGDYLETLLPGFEEQYQRVRDRPGSLG